jgi:hypothetical protein
MTFVPYSVSSFVPRQEILLSSSVGLKKNGGVEKEKLAIYVPMIYIQPRTVRNVFDAVRYITRASGGEGVGPWEMESRLSRAL